MKKEKGIIPVIPSLRHCEEVRRSNLWTNRKIASFLAMTDVPRNDGCSSQ